MSASIVDGTGKGYSGKVNKFNQFEVIAESVPSEGFNSRRGKAFIIHAECHTSANADGGFLHIKNNDTDFDMEITRIYIDPHTITPTDLICTQVFDATIANGTVNSNAIVQKNRETAESFNLTVTQSDSSSDMTYTGGTQYHAFPIKTMTSQQRNMNQTNIIPASKSILFGWKTASGGNATDGEVVSFSVNIVKVDRTL